MPGPPPAKRAYDGPLPATAQLHTHELRVVDDATGRAIPDAQALVLEFVDLKFHDFRTDAAGRLRVEYPEIEDMGAVIEVRKEGYVPQRYSPGDEAGRPVDTSATARMRAARPIGGTVRDEAGRPIAGAVVVVTATGHAEPRSRAKIPRGYEITFEVPTVTDADGRWRSACVSPDATNFDLQLIHPEYVSGRCATLGGSGRRPPLDGLRAFSDTQIMARGVRLSGRVLDLRGRPIAGAEVVDATSGLTFLTFIRRATADAEGRFCLHVDPKERVTLGIRARGYAQVDWAWKPGAGEAPFEVRLSPGRPFLGRVVDHLGRPVPGAMVSISSASAFRGIHLRIWSDPDGHFRWDEAPDRDVPLSFSRAGYIPKDERVRVPDDREFLIALTPSLTVKAKVLDARTGAPVKPFTLEVEAFDPATGLGIPLPGERREVGDGEYRMFLDARTPAYRFSIKAAGYRSFESRVLRGDEGELDYEVRMDR
jgi:protocatechuate 3,4-dioxygenase beta subunit